MYKRIITAALLFGMAAQAPPAHAQTCAPRASVVERLNIQFKETLTAQGLQNGNALIEIFASKDTGSFTVLMTNPNGVSCVVSTGSHWLPIKPELPGVSG